MRKVLTVTQTLAKDNNPDYNYDKLMEEMHELAEVILKRRNKKGHPKEPPLQDLIDEIGDVKLRLDVVINMHGVFAVEQRVKAKESRLKEHLTNKDHQGRL